ncbi:hypothetical protein FOL47_011151 [Perkinsus chesapeaki]|uniref:RRM domain-containing protein n=1 Tax=Perkinsus chesapeaki TaxID=330153 RepID=A0A7J6MN07_PERCH|nr:hypothetical protein FOL47_011151 [Perkinsus chesapeaki]
MSPAGSTGDRPVRTGPKVFIGGVPFTATEKDVAEYFSQFGPIVSAEIKVDKATGRSRGFGFVVFETAEGKMNAMRRKGDLFIHNRQINIGDTTADRVFVGGVPPQISNESIANHFSKYGPVQDIEGPPNKNYLFVVFTDPSGARNCLMEHPDNHVIDGVRVDVKKAQPRNQPHSAQGAAPPQAPTHPVSIPMAGPAGEYYQQPTPQYPSYGQQQQQQQGGGRYDPPYSGGPQRASPGQSHGAASGGRFGYAQPY